MSYYGRISWGRRLSNPHFEKNAKQVFELLDFHSSQWQKNINNYVKKGVSNKKP
jgi:hypothetical protein